MGKGTEGGTASADTMKELPDFDLDLVAPAVNVGAVGPIRVLKAFLPLRRLFETKRHDKEGPVFITYTGEAYPW